MGLILDSSILVAAEREGKNANQTLAAISAKIGNLEVSISVVTLIELAHGAARAMIDSLKGGRFQLVSFPARFHDINSPIVEPPVLDTGCL